jgi:hypothetical protein
MRLFTFSQQSSSSFSRHCEPRIKTLRGKLREAIQKLINRHSVRFSRVFSLSRTSLAPHSLRGCGITGDTESPIGLYYKIVVVILAKRESIAEQYPKIKLFFTYFGQPASGLDSRLPAENDKKNKKRTRLRLPRL